ncbi:dolichyl-P-Man:Man(7)GlcNAc(2)-PP-dolichol alpha-1,6-mannosyltransferase, partial [Lunasporangiospora selenospora]
VVPRTFVGPLFLAITSWPFMFLAKLVSPALVLPKSISGQLIGKSLSLHTKLNALIIRLALGLYTYFGWRQLGRGIQHQFGKNIRLLFMIVSSCQFHWMFYAGRTLPNIFALGLVNLAYSYWMRASAPTNGSVTKYETE